MPIAKNYIEKTRPPSTTIFSSIFPIIKGPRSDDLVSRVWRLTKRLNPLGRYSFHLRIKCSATLLLRKWSFL